MSTNTSPYIFISYAHFDSALVLPAIQKLQSQGICLWYDSGIEAGSEWPEFIAQKVLDCSKFVLFMSKAYIESQNCKRELNFAISRKKDILTIFLEDVVLSPGVEMQLGTYQAIFRNRFPNDEAFRSSVANEPFFNLCKSDDSPPQATVSFCTSAPASGNDAPTALPAKSRLLACVLAFFFGSFGVHKFYLGQKTSGFLYLGFFWTYIPTFLGLFDALVLLFQSNAKFAEKYKCIPK